MAGALEIVDEYNVTSAVSSVILGGGSSGSSGLNVSIDSTYDTYFVTGSGIVHSSGGSGQGTKLRWTVSGSEDTTSNKKQWAQRAMYSDTSNETRFYTSDYTELTLQDGGAEAPGENTCFYLYLNLFADSTRGSALTVHSVFDQFDGARVHSRLGGALDVTAQACDGIKIFGHSTTTFNAGTFRLFGLAN
jgi:hypothetical protein